MIGALPAEQAQGQSGVSGHPDSPELGLALTPLAVQKSETNAAPLNVAQFHGRTSNSGLIVSRADSSASNVTLRGPATWPALRCGKRLAYRGRVTGRSSTESELTAMLVATLCLGFAASVASVGWEGNDLMIRVICVVSRYICFNMQNSILFRNVEVDYIMKITEKQSRVILIGVFS